MTEAKIIRFPLQSMAVGKPTEIKEIIDVEQLDNVAIDEDAVQQEEDLASEEINNEAPEISKDYEAGYAEGLEEGKKIIAEQEEYRNEILNDINAKLISLDVQRMHYIHKITEEAGFLAIGLAKKMIGDVSHANEHRIMKFFDEVMSKIKDESKITIYVEKSCEKLIKDKLQEITVALSPATEVNVIVKENFASGKCEIDWDMGKATLDPQALMESFEKDFFLKEQKKEGDTNTPLKNTETSDDIEANRKEIEEQ